MKHEFLRILLVGRMAVNTHSRHLSILDNSIFIEGRQVTLIESHMAKHLITRGNTTIGKSPLIKGIITYANIKVLILFPLSVFSYADSKRKLSPFILCCQFMPISNIEVSLITLSMNLAAFRTFYNHIHTVNIGIGTTEVQGCDFSRYSYSYIIRIYLRQFVYLSSILYLT